MLPPARSATARAADDAKRGAVTLDGLLKQLTKTVLETALNQELTEHLGHEKHGAPVAGNVRNGTRANTVLTEGSGQLQVDVPRDRDGSFEPQIVRKWQRRLASGRFSLNAKDGNVLAAISVIISVLAFSFSFFVFLDSRKKDQRDIFLKMHELLIGSDLQRGRYILLQKVTDEASVERLTETEWQDINRVLATFNALGLYLVNKYVRERDVMDLWAMNICRTWKAAQPYIRYREHRQGWPPWKYFAILAEKAQQELSHRADGREVKVWRRHGDVQASPSMPPDHQA